MKTIQTITRQIKIEKIGVIPTDTIYGVAASAMSKKAVERAYRIMKRNTKKPFIILISSIKDLALFNIKLDSATRNILKKIWPGKVSVILPARAKKFEYLHRGTKTLAFRMPKKQSFVKILRKTGPLISSSANPEGKKPAETIVQAKKYFEDKIDFYTDTGKIKSAPSTLVEIKDGRICVLREGAFQITNHVTRNM